MTSPTDQPLQAQVEHQDEEPVPDLEGWLQQVAEAGLYPQRIAQAMEDDGVAPATAWALAAAAVIRHGPQRLTSLFDSRAAHEAAAQLRLWFAEAGATAEPTEEPAGLLDPGSLQAGGLVAAGQAMQVHLVSQSPRMAVFGNLLTPEECEAFVHVGRDLLKPDSLIDNNSPTGGSIINLAVRSSEGCVIELDDSPLVGVLHDRLDALIGGGRARRERLVLSRYRPGQEFKPHFDHFEQEVAGYEQLVRKGGQRIASLVIYLNEVQRGGETVFPDLGLRISPLRGGATYFTYRRVDGSPDASALHAGAPVVEGEKWIATVWFREHAI